MAEKGKMPPQLLAHFKAKSEEKGGQGDKEKRKEAVNKARIRMEESSRRKGNDKTEKAGKERP